MTALQEIAAWAVGDGIESLPDEGVQLVKRAFVDTLGVSLLGARLEGPRIIAEIECSAGGRPEASIVGMRRKTEVRSAALINGTSVHADLFDDNSDPLIAHPSAPPLRFGELSYAQFTEAAVPTASLASHRARERDSSIRGG